MKPYRLTEEEYNRILAFKRDLHMHPELSRQEFQTTEKIRKFLMDLPDFEILPLNTETKTGVAAKIRGCGGTGSEQRAREVLLRADIDALPQNEEFDSPWKSQNPGVMHACGHDFHTAALLGAALLLQRAKDDGELHGTVDLLFQPAEEGTAGAHMVIESELFERIRPDLCFGLHNWPSVQTGKIACHEGPLMAGKRNFEIVSRGVGGHGAMPHLCADAIVCAAAVIQSLQTVVSRNTAPLDSVLLTLGRIEGGVRENIIADRVSILGTVRSLSDDALDRAISRIETIVQKTAEAYECSSEILWKERVRAVWNSPEMTALARKCAAMTGCEVTDAPPSLASEDFASYRQFAPSFFYWVGSTASGDIPVELHKPTFHTDDTALRYAAELLAISAMKGLEQQKKKKKKTSGVVFRPGGLFCVQLFK